MSDFARAVPNFKPLEFRFPLLEKRSALLYRLFVGFGVEKFDSGNIAAPLEVAPYEPRSRIAVGVRDSLR